MSKLFLLVIDQFWDQTSSTYTSPLRNLLSEFCLTTYIDFIHVILFLIVLLLNYNKEIKFCAFIFLYICNNSKKKKPLVTSTLRRSDDNLNLHSQVPTSLILNRQVLLTLHNKWDRDEG